MLGMAQTRRMENATGKGGTIQCAEVFVPKYVPSLARLTFLLAAVELDHSKFLRLTRIRGLSGLGYYRPVPTGLIRTGGWRSFTPVRFCLPFSARALSSPAPLRNHSFNCRLAMLTCRTSSAQSKS
jgi:hypothetical protein